MRGERRQLDVGQHAALLRAVAVGAVELLHGDLQRAHRRRVGHAEQLLAQVQQALHGALAVGRVVADDQAAAVVLDGAGENLAGAGAELADQHHQRARPGDARIGVVVGLHAAVGVLDLHDRPVVDEQAGQVDRLGERAAAVAAQVEHHGVDALAR